MITIIGVLILLNMGSVIYCQENVMFNYQGRVKVQGHSFTGTGNFKFAIVNNAGDESLWSNDGTSTGGGEPTASIAISVTDGIFNAMVGDPDAGMSLINRTVFNHPSQIKLRTWFSDGTHGFQQLLPDQKLVNVELLGLRSGTEDFTIYVNGTTGNDENNGLTTDTAKKKIQAAVDILPERLRCNVTIDIADGIYREEIHIFGISMDPSKALILKGDESWIPPTGNPAVRVTGTDDDITPVKTRNYAFIIRNCTGIVIQGILFDYCKSISGYISKGTCIIKSCKAANNDTGFGFNSGIGYFLDCVSFQNVSYGFYVSSLAAGSFTNCRSTYNGKDGFLIATTSTGTLTNCIGNNNGSNGLYLNSAQVGMFGTGEFSNNTGSGIKAIHFSKLWFDSEVPDLYSGQINNNGFYPLNVGYESYCENHTLNTFSGNSPNNNVYLHHGGNTY